VFTPTFWPVLQLASWLAAWNSGYSSNGFTTCWWEIWLFCIGEVLYDRESTRVETANVRTRFFILNSISTTDNFKEVDTHLSAVSVQKWSWRVWKEHQSQQISSQGILYVGTSQTNGTGWCTLRHPRSSVSRSLTVDFILFFFSLFYFSFLFLFLFLEQLGLGFISHAVTSVKNWWQSHKTDHGTWENGVEGSGTKWRYTAWTTHASLMLYSWSVRVGCTVASTDHEE